MADSRRGAREVATYVLEQGHRRIAVIGGPLVFWTAGQRMAGYREAFAAAGLDPDAVPVLAGDYQQASGAKLAERLLSQAADSRPTALLCANDLMAFGALEYCRAAGIRVPEDVSIAGFDDLPISRLVAPALTTVRQPARDMGYAAGCLLFEQLDGGLNKEPPAALPVTRADPRIGPPPAA